MSIRPIYLDCHATTPVDERVLAAMMPYFTEHFGRKHQNAEYFWGIELSQSQIQPRF